MTERTLLLHLHGPLQAWGPAGAGNDRGSLPHPTRSGVVGMLACALGLALDAEQELAELDAAVTVAIRIDDPGVATRDFRSARVLEGAGIGKPDRLMPADAIKARLRGQAGQAQRALTDDWLVGDVSTKLGTDTYRADARYIVAISADADLVQQLAAAVAAPAFPLYLGRASCPAPLDLLLGQRDGSGRDALADLEWQVPPAQRSAVRNVTRTDLGVALTVLADAQAGDGRTERISGARVVSLLPGRRRYRDWQVTRLQVTAADHTSADAPADPFDLDL